VPHIRAGGRGGSIILTSSNLGVRGAPGCSHYSASKHGVVGLAQSLANELAAEFIRVNTWPPTNPATPLVASTSSTLGTWSATESRLARAGRRHGFGDGPHGFR
jgi:NAD(P)-dependent dehydrogenase (short-subunit alcohol dehydrogenase family)